MGLRVARVEGRREQWFARKRQGVAAGWAHEAITYNRPDSMYQAAPDDDVIWWGSGPNVGPINTQLTSAIADAELHTAQGRLDADVHVDLAIALLEGLVAEDTSAAIAALESAITNLALGTEEDDDAAIANIQTAQAAVATF